MTRLDWLYVGVLGLLVLVYFGGDNSVFQEIEIVVLGCLFTLIYIALQVRDESDQVGALRVERIEFRTGTAN